VFGQITQGETIDDLTEEFFAYWHGWHCFVDVQGEDSSDALSGGNSRPTALSLNACPYLATSFPRHRPQISDPIVATTILIHGETPRDRPTTEYAD